MSDAAQRSGRAEIRLLAPGSRVTLQEHVYRALKGQLASGGFVPGQVVTVREIAESMGTSPMPVREAMRRLASERALDIMPNGSVRVRVIRSRHWLQLRDIRLRLEGLAVRQSAQHIDGASVAEAERLDRAMSDAALQGDLERVVALNREFHFLIYRAAQNEVLLEMIDGIWLQIGPSLMASVYAVDRDRSYGSIMRTVEHHAPLVAALRRRDPDAAEGALVGDLSQPFLESQGALGDAIEGRRPSPKG